MQRWFFIESEKGRRKMAPTAEMEKTEDNVTVEEETFCDRVFSVFVPNLGARETVCITGNLAELGEWHPERVVPLVPQRSSEEWSVTIRMLETAEIWFRYCICNLLDEPKRVIVRRFEAHIHPRKWIPDDTVHTFGEYHEKSRVNTGWLTDETLVQLKLFQNPLKLRSKYCKSSLRIKVTPVSLSFANEMQHFEELSHSGDTADIETKKDTRVDVAVLNNNDCETQPQDQFGKDFKHGDNIIFNVYVPGTEDIAYLIDVFLQNPRACIADPPTHIGYAYILPTTVKHSEGRVEVPVTSNINHRPIGMLTVEYLVVKPMEAKLSNLMVSYAKHWDSSWKGLDVGHRGLGNSFKTKGGHPVRENTVASLKQAAASGADLLEFDVQLSKDMIPVIYHDFYVCISMKRKKNIDFAEMLEIAVKDLSLEQLQKLKVYHLVEGRTNETLFNDEHLEEHQPFPTLSEICHTIDPHVGFNVELKWNMERADGSYELDNPFDMNTYVDKVLEVLLAEGGERRVVMSCFNPDICTMVRQKQNKYPIMFLTQGRTERYPTYRDIRCQSIPAAVQSAVNTDILGVVVHTEDLLRDPSQIHLATDAGLVIFCWGDDNNNKETIARLKSLGLHAVIYDKLDQYTTKEVKESIFLVEARDSQRDVIKKVASHSNLDSSVRGSSILSTQSELRDDEKDRQLLSTFRLMTGASTATMAPIESEVNPQTSKSKQLKHTSFSGVLENSVSSPEKRPKNEKDINSKILN